MSNLRPQVITTISVNTSLVAPAGSRSALMIGTAIWGPQNVVTAVSDINQFISTFGGDKAGTGITGVKGADLFFNNGGTLKFLRLADGTAAYATKNLLNGVTNVITITAKYKGTYGNNIVVTTTDVSGAREVTVTDGTNTEFYTNGGVGYTTNNAIVSAINATSQLVTASVQSGQGTINLADAQSIQLISGADGETGLTITDYTTAFDTYLLNEDYNFLLLPGYTTDSGLNTLATRLSNRAAVENKFSRFISGVAQYETIATMKARTSSNKRLTLVAPSVGYTSRVDGSAMILDGSYLACAYAGKLCTLDIENSITHEPITVDNLYVDATGKKYYTKTEQESVLGAGVAPISIVGTSTAVIRGITRNGSSTSIFFDDYIVDIIDYVQAELQDYLDTVIGQPKKAIDMRVYEGRCDAILQTMQNQGIIESYQNTVIVEGVSPDTIAVAVSIKPTYNTNFVNLTISVN